MKIQRKEFPIKNNPGIYRVMFWCTKTSSWKSTGKFRSMRRVAVGGFSKKEQAVFDNIEDAKLFRNQVIEKGETESLHRNDLEESGGLTFRELVQRWRTVHYMTIEKSSQQKYDKLLPTLDFLNPYRVSDIDSDVIVSLAIFWKNEYPRSWRRKSFVKEWQLLNVVLTYFREEVKEGRDYSIPSFKRARKITVLTPEIDGEVKYLTREETVNFLSEMKNERCEDYYNLALLQYFFALRISEAAAISLDAIDIKRKILTIKRAVSWEATTWVATINEYTKTKTIRYLPIPDAVLPLLRRLVEKTKPENPLVFKRRDGTPMNRKTVATNYNRALKRLGYKHVSGTHFLRRTSATLANEATGDYDGVSKFLGHSSIQATKRYVGKTDMQKQRISSALEIAVKIEDE